jgi:prophage regulatory protein
MTTCLSQQNKNLVVGGLLPDRSLSLAVANNARQIRPVDFSTATSNTCVESLLPGATEPETDSAGGDLIELIRLATVMRATAISRPQVYALMRQGRFPKSVKLGRATAWVRKEINEWVQRRIAERDAS